MEREFTSDQYKENKQDYSADRGTWGEIQGKSQTEYTTKIRICLSRKRANQRTNQNETFW